MRYDYTSIVLPDGVAVIGKFIEAGSQGWELVSVVDKTAYFKRPIDLQKNICANCKFFSKSADDSGVCTSWKVATGTESSCENFAGNLSIPPGSATPEKAHTPSLVVVPDEVSAWHWQPQVERGERRIEALTNEVAGLKSVAHKHRVILIVGEDHKVVQGKTDMVNGHDHLISFLGMTNEADAHTHQFGLPG